MAANPDESSRHDRLVDAKVLQLRDAVTGARTPFLLSLLWAFVWASAIYTHDYGYVAELLKRFETSLVSSPSCACSDDRTIGRYHSALRAKDVAVHASANAKGHPGDKCGDPSVCLPGNVTLCDDILTDLHSQCKKVLEDSVSDLRKEEIDSWIVTMPWLGMKTTVFDFSIVGNVGTLLLSLWFFFTSRREHHAIRSFVTVGKPDEDGDSWVPFMQPFDLIPHTPSELSGSDLHYVYQSVAHRFVFLTSRRNWLLLFATTLLIIAPASVSVWNCWTDLRDIHLFRLAGEVLPRFLAGIFLTGLVVVVTGKALEWQLRTAALLNAWYLASVVWFETPECKIVTIQPGQQRASAKIVESVGSTSTARRD